MDDISLALAVMWHDPPWKPWAIGAQSLEARATITGTGSFPERILNGLKSVLTRGVYKSMLGELSIKDTDKLFDTVKNYYNKILERGAGDARSHEEQAAIIPALLAAMIDLQDMEDLKRLANQVFRAGEMIVARDGRVECADRLASALDRTILQEIVDECGDRCKKIERLRMVNPFNPDPSYRDEIGLCYEISGERIAHFLLNYTTAIVKILRAAKEDADKAKLSRLLRDSAFLLLEPIWYATMGPAYKLYIPPADTRLPTHTVFDHINAALMTMLWCHRDGSRDGILAIVDLAGVQSWIQESRALRDLWASSWIASLLAWKAVESLVEEHGPGVMVSPPARLTPFVATSLILSKLDERHGAPHLTVDLVIPESRRLTIGIGELLGLPHIWPVDPVTPSRLIIALPPSVDKHKVEDAARRGVGDAWKAIMSKEASLIKALARILEGYGINPSEAGLAASLADLVEGLEAPLAMRVYTVRIRDVMNEARRIDDKHEEALYYSIALMKLREEESRVRVKVPGRRLGQGYLQYALEAHKFWNRRKVTCTVCGRALAIVDGNELKEKLAENPKLSWKVEENEIIHEVRKDKLCPYCLAKRLLRRMLVARHHNLSQHLVGVEVTEEARDRLSFATTDAYTSRTKLMKDKLIKEAERIAGILSKDLEKNEECYKKLPPQLREVAAVGNTFSGFQGRCMREAQSILLEAIHDNTFLREALKALKNSNALEKRNDEHWKELAEILWRVAREAGRYRSKYAVLMMDVDMMGSGVLSGKLSLRPEEWFSHEYYPKHVINLAEEEAKNRFADRYNMLIDKLHRYYIERMGSRSGGGSLKERLNEARPTLIITPSYHFAVSRSLAIQSMLDRQIIEDRGGMVIYAGGDDLLAILPPIAKRNNEYHYPALTAAIVARQSYWGRLEEPPLDRVGEAAPRGFKVLPLRDGDLVVIAGVAPTLSVYGRSAAVYIADTATPIWITLETTHELEEAKDDVVRRTITGEAVEWHKDILIVASDTGGAAILPFTWLGESKVEELNPEKPIVDLLSHILGDPSSRDLSKSIFTDYHTQAPTLYRIARATHPDTAIPEAMVKRLIRRNKAVQEIDEESIHNQLISCLGGSRAYSRVICIPRDSGVAASMAEASGYSVAEEGMICSQLVSQAMLSARIISGSF